MTEIVGRAPAVAESAGPGGFGPKLKTLGSETLIYGLSSIVGRFLSYLLQPYYAHQFVPAESGVQSVVYGYIPFIYVVLYLGMDVTYMRNLAAAKDEPLSEHQRSFTMSMGTVASVGGAIAAVLLAAADVLAPFAKLDVVSFRYMVAIAYTDGLLITPYAYLRMTSQAIRYAALKLAFVILSIALNIFLIGYRHWGVEAIFFANLASNLIVLALFVGDIARFFRPALLSGAPWRMLWAFALPIIPASLAVNVVENGDLIRLNYLPDRVAQLMYHMMSKDLVGIYNFNYKLGVAMLLVVQMFRMAWMPFSLQHARDPGAPQLYSRVLTALMLVCGAVFLAISLLLPSFAEVPWVHGYVKPQYWLGLPIVPVILCGYIFSGVYTVVTAGLYIERRTSVLPWIAGAGALLNIAICVVAAPRWGMVGVAWATPAAYGLMAVLAAWQSNRVFPVPFEWMRLARLGVLVAILFGVDRWLAGRGVGPLSVGGLASKAALLAALPCVLLATGFFRSGELRALKAMVPGR